MPPKRTHHPCDKACAYCGTVFHAASRYAILHQQFCSRTCRSAVYGNGRPATAYTKRKCRQCKKPMQVLPCHKATKFYCSNVCQWTYHRETGVRAGENNPAWKGGANVYWKQKARERDDFTCQAVDCSVRDTGKATHAHHIIPRAAGGSDSLENLTTLCQRHHQEFERALFLELVKRCPKVVKQIAEDWYASLKEK